ncbi:predicted protein [Botrytis cinerea T4]|uniref:Uncharacterized protein n=1 Tax=Botryotinia fuckeliana (strain T4) TaxID=999810 RepID=G2YF40_BOTF4|nr:predicted protein [Botrytis cinerea T4]
MTSDNNSSSNTFPTATATLTGKLLFKKLGGGDRRRLRDDSPD